MKVVIDTNVLLVAISPNSKHHWLWLQIVAGDILLCCTNEILNEYEEIIAQKMGQVVSDAVLDLLLDLPSLTRIEKYYNWQLVDADPDDNKFIDCAIAASAQYLVSEDKHLRVIQNFPYFGIKLVSLTEFAALYRL